MVYGQKKIIRKILHDYNIAATYLIIFILLSIFIPFFFTWRNMVGLALSITTLGIVASGMLYVLASGNIDLSVGSTIAFTSMVTAILINMTGLISLGIIGGIIAGGIIGFINGYLIARYKLNPLIVTLATMQIIRGMGYIIFDGKAIGIKEGAFFDIVNNSFLNIPNPVWITVILFIVSGVILNKTAFGRYTRVIGANQEAANLTGINIEKMQIWIFIFQGIVAGLAGVVLASRMTSGQPNIAQGFELNVISACVLGGVSLKGGSARISGVIIGVLLMGTVQNALNLINTPTFYHYVVRGSILLIAISLDKFNK